MKTLTTTQLIENGKVSKTVIHTATSCHSIDKVLVRVSGENKEAVDLILNMYQALSNALDFVSGFENDEQNNIESLLAEFRKFDIGTDR